MATITVNLDETVKRKLEARAALNGRSMEAEVREMLSSLVADGVDPPREDIETAIHKRFAALGGGEREIPPSQVPNRPVEGPMQHAPENAEPKKGLGTAIHELFAPLGGVELEIPPRRFSDRTVVAPAQNPQRRVALKDELGTANVEPEEDFGTAIRKLFAPLGGVELQIPPRRKSHRPIPTFE